MELFKLNSLDFPDDFKVSKSLKILGFSEDIEIETKKTILDILIQYILKTNVESKNDEKIFDYEYDFKYYFYDFKKLGYDLNKDKISWWEFDSILEGLFLDKHCAIGQVLEYRTYIKPKKYNNPQTAIKEEERQREKFYLEKQKQYKLPVTKSQINEGYEKLWGYLEQKAGEK